MSQSDPTGSQAINGNSIPNSQSTSAPNGTVTTPNQLSSQIDLLVSLHLWAWPALTLAIQNAWGGSAQIAADKRDWFAGAVSELLTSTPPQLADVGDLEEVLLQVMFDEFEVVVDDGSAEQTARGIWGGMNKLINGDVSELQDMYVKWEEKEKKGNSNKEVAGFVKGEDPNQETDEEADDDDDDDDRNGNAMDVDMDEAPPLVNGARQPRERVEPEVDEEGFTKVVNKKKR
ncbi:hypothetical protein ABEF95_003401 [Exophiala dermatitidis]